MKEPKRLLSRGATDFERQLLRSVVNERPSALLRSRMQRGLGLVGPLAWASNVKALFGTLSVRAVAAVVAIGVVGASGFAAVRWLGRSADHDPMGNVPSSSPVASSPVASSPAASSPASTDPISSSPVAPSSEPAPPVPALARPLPPEPPMDPSHEAPPAPSPAAPSSAALPSTKSAPPDVGSGSAESGSSGSGEPAVSDEDSRLREEIALLDTARAALQRGDRDAARTTLSAYRERFPIGILRREAKVLSSRAEGKMERSDGE